MNRAMETELVRLIHGELDEDRARELQRRVDNDGELRAAYDRLQATWQALELPPTEPAPAGFAARVTAAAFEVDAGLVPPWFRDTLLGRAATAAALSGGILIGILAAYPQQSSAEYADFLSDETSMAEGYWDVLDNPDQILWDEVEE